MAATIAVLGLVVSAVVLLFVRPWSAPIDAYRTDGPVGVADRIGVQYVVDPDVSTTWGMALPANSGAGPAVLKTVEPMGVEGLQVLGVGLCDASDPGCSIVNAYGWPPASVEPRAIDGAVLAPSGAPPILAFLIGVELPHGVAAGAIDSIRIVYEVDGVTFTVTEPWSLQLNVRGSEPTPSGADLPTQ